ncbi:MAG: tRNA pseudouridine(55) synthase TruB [Candidatus Aerophobetes bacterium]|nr:tRNA pseudouridine(55) synthase TruB [Candidatus Aerophobetes bacterium]
MDGLLLVDKPKGITSYDVVSKIRKILKVRKVGHTGTLDPAATGLLLICVGKATKLTPFLQNLDKDYEGELIFGLTTTSLDEEGEILEEKDASSLNRDRVEELFSCFKGKIKQVPPMFSAIHWKGKKLYHLAREGVEVPRPSRNIQIYELRLVNFIPGQHPRARFKLHCSKGTYVRSLCSDIGKASDYGGYQVSLCRTRVGLFDLSKATQLEELDEGGIRKEIYSLREALPHLPLVEVKKETERIIKWGRPLYLAHIERLPLELKKEDLVRLCNPEGELLAVATCLQDGTHFFKDRIGFKYLRVLI